MRTITDRPSGPPAAVPPPGAQWQAALARWLDDGTKPSPSETEQPSQAKTKP